MPSFLTDGAAIGVILAYIFKRLEESDEKKKLRVLALLIGLVVFVQIPYYFDNVKNTGDEVLDDNLEVGYDTIRAGIRALVSYFVFIIGSLIVIMS